MKILITGAFGFIGSRLCQQLSQNGHTVFALEPAWSKKRLDGFMIPGVVDVEADLNQYEAIQKVISGIKPDTCIHLAWFTKPGQYLEAPENIPLVFASLNLLQCLMDQQCKHFIGVGTCAEYQPQQTLLDETSPTEALSLYAAAKISFHQMGSQLAKKSSTQFSWARIFYPYGPGEDPGKIIPATIHSLSQNQVFKTSPGQQVRDYIYISDILNAFETLLNHPSGGIFNIATGSGVTIRSILSKISEILGKENLIDFGSLPPRSWDPPFIVGSNQKLKELGWAPQVTIAEGLKICCDWWRPKI